MAIINIVTPPLSKKKFSGGILCIMQYASGLKKKGHQVNIVPILPCDKPTWFDTEKMLILPSFFERLTWVFKLFNKIVWSNGGIIKNLKGEGKENLRRFLESLFFLNYRFVSYELARSITLSYIREVMPEADITLATSFQTALPVALYGTGSKYYFMQHFELLFKNEFPNPLLAGLDAKQSYCLNLNMIANSPWLKAKLESEIPDSQASLCPNAIDHTIFYGEPKLATDSQEIKIISYGGRDAIWKGFREMAEAMKLVRSSMPELNIRWLVYGDSLLPPDNDIASYEALGFLGSKELANAYRDADILLSASWYESFPLFPLEAMACGLPVITTQAGTESYAIPNETAEVVEAQNPDSIANGLIKLLTNKDYRNYIARNGNKISKNFTWEKSVEKMEEILLKK
ncbi:MAG: glycosyltransferase family 4 protein [Cyanobacteria bacterium J06643_5]